jgi:hypothetical protein
MIGKGYGITTTITKRLIELGKNNNCQGSCQ